MAILLMFVGLQLLDAATTLLFLGRGIAEGNPLVGWMLQTGLRPALALAAVKAAACFLGWLAWKSGRYRLLRRANVFFALCVMWNAAAILSAGRSWHGAERSRGVQRIDTNRLGARKRNGTERQAG